MLIRNLSLCFVVLSTLIGNAQDDSAGADADSKPSGPVSAIKTEIQSYVDAFNARDLEKLVAHWSEDAAYINRSTGQKISGRQEIQKDFAQILGAEDAPNLSISSQSIEMISPSVALERGTATIIREDDSEQTAYNAIYVKRGDRWLLDRVTERDVTPPPSNYERLKALSWMIGQWIDSDSHSQIQLDCRWTKNRNYISRRYSVVTKQGVTSSGLQIIGWDAKKEQICSWLFDSDGGRIEGVWSQQDGDWRVRSIAHLPDGASGSFTSILRPVDQNTYSFKKINRMLDGKLLPNTDAVTVSRREGDSNAQ